MLHQNVKELTLEHFTRYGAFGQMINPQADKIGEEPIEFFRDMIQLDLGGASIASFSTCRSSRSIRCAIIPESLSRILGRLISRLPRFGAQAGRGKKR